LVEHNYRGMFVTNKPSESHLIFENKSINEIMW
jgi:hypothetical protein